MGIVGVGVANSVANILVFSLLITAHYSIDEIKDTVKRPDRRALNDIYPYLELGLPICFMLAMEIWCFEVQCLLCGLISVHTQAALVVTNNLYVFFWCPAMGMQSAGCTCVGFQIGRQDIKRAKDYYRVSFHCVICIVCVSCLLFYVTFESLI